MITEAEASQQGGNRKMETVSVICDAKQKCRREATRTTCRKGIDLRNIIPAGREAIDPEFRANMAVILAKHQCEVD